MLSKLSGCCMPCPKLGVPAPSAALPAGALDGSVVILVSCSGDKTLPATCTEETLYVGLVNPEMSSIVDPAPEVGAL